MLAQPSMLGYYRNASHASASLTASAWGHWMFVNSFLIALTAGVAIVPGAVAGASRRRSAPATAARVRSARSSACSS